MSDARMSHEDLEQYAAGLAEMRDQALAEAEKYPALASYSRGQATAFRLALSRLYGHSHHAYGQSYAEQTTQITTPQGEEASKQ